MRPRFPPLQSSFLQRLPVPSTAASGHASPALCRCSSAPHTNSVCLQQQQLAGSYSRLALAVVLLRNSLGKPRLQSRPWLNAPCVRSGGRGPARGRPGQRGERAAGPGVQWRGGRARALRAAAVVGVLARLHAQRLVRAPRHPRPFSSESRVYGPGKERLHARWLLHDRRR